MSATVFDSVGHTNLRLYLASQSPRRAELLQQICVEFERLVVDIDESLLDDELALDYVDRLAKAKAAKGWRQLIAGGQSKLPVLGSDTAVVLDGQIMGKPRDRDHGIAMLSALSGRSHQVMSGVCLYYGLDEAAPLIYADVNVTEVTFRRISESELNDYWSTGESEGKAGAYAIQGRAAVFIERIEGSYSSVVGLPLFETQQLLNRMEHQLVTSRLTSK
jgi:septum formation protein